MRVSDGIGLIGIACFPTMLVLVTFNPVTGIGVGVMGVLLIGISWTGPHGSRDG